MPNPIVLIVCMRTVEKLLLKTDILGAQEVVSTARGVRGHRASFANNLKLDTMCKFESVVKNFSTTT